jgi:hypothetical protein
MAGWMGISFSYYWCRIHSFKQNFVSSPHLLPFPPSLLLKAIVKYFPHNSMCILSFRDSKSTSSVLRSSSPPPSSSLESASQLSLSDLSAMKCGHEEGETVEGLPSRQFLHSKQQSEQQCSLDWKVAARRVPCRTPRTEERDCTD